MAAIRVGFNERGVAAIRVGFNEGGVAVIRLLECFLDFEVAPRVLE